MYASCLLAPGLVGSGWARMWVCIYGLGPSCLMLNKFYSMFVNCAVLFIQCVYFYKCTGVSFHFRYFLHSLFHEREREKERERGMKIDVLLLRKVDHYILEDRCP